jgi:hypothetical protein
MASLYELRDLPVEGDYFFKCHHLLTQVPQGRPKKERYRKEDIYGPRGAAAARQLKELAGDGNDEV